jgi:hypothetical protein
VKRKQRLVAVHITTTPATLGEPTIVPVGGESLEELLERWRVAMIQPLGQGSGPGETYAALLLLEESEAEPSLGRLGFGRE